MLTIIQVFCRGHASSPVERMIISQVNSIRVQDLLYLITYSTEKLRESRYGEPEDINVMARSFDRTTKPIYKGTSKPCFIKFGRRENDPQFDIQTGSVKISG
jgi:hypothetical protein